MIQSIPTVTTQRSTSNIATGARLVPGTRQQGAISGDTVNLSISGNVMDAVDSIFNLGERRSGVGGDHLSREERNQVFKMVGELLKSGYAGYEVLRVGNRIERHDVDMQIGDNRLRNARIYHEPVKHTSIRA